MYHKLKHLVFKEKLVTVSKTDFLKYVPEKKKQNTEKYTESL